MSLLCSLLVVATATGSDWESKYFVDPYDVASPSGVWRAHVEPTDPRGVGRSTLTIRHGKSLAATVELKFTFKSAAITDAGYVVGYAEHEIALENVEELNDLVIASIAPDGSIVREDTVAHTLQGTSLLERRNTPMGLFVDPSGAWFVVRVEHTDAKPLGEAWWRHAVATNARREELDPVSPRPADVTVRKPRVGPALMSSRRLREVSAIELVPPERRSVGQQVADFDFDPAGGLIALQQESTDRLVSVFVTDAGEFVREVAWQPVVGKPIALRALGDGRWIVSAAASDRGPGGWFVIDARDGKLVRLEGIDAASPDGVMLEARAARATKDGGFVAFVCARNSATSVERVIRCDGAGRVRWTVLERDDTTQTLPPRDVCVLGDGTIAVLENSPARVEMFDDAGHAVRTVDLEATTVRSPAYLVSICADLGGGFMIRRSSGTGYRVNASGEVTAQLRVKTQRFDAYGRPIDVRCAPDGKLWTCGESSLALVGEAGDVVRLLRPLRDPQRLSLPREATIDSFGRAWIRDDATGSLHGFGPDGAPLWIAAIRLEAGTADVASIVARADGGMLVRMTGPRSDPFECVPPLRFTPSGDALGQIAESCAGDVLVELRGGSYVSCGGFPLLARLLDREMRVVADLTRMPDGRWSRELHAATLASDGRAALLWGDSIVMLDDDGRSTEQILTPSGAERAVALAVNGAHALVHDHGHEAWLYSFSTKEWQQLFIPDERDETRRSIALSPDGESIVTIDDASYTLRTFAIAE